MKHFLKHKFLLVLAVLTFSFCSVPSPALALAGRNVPHSIVGTTTIKCASGEFITNNTCCPDPDNKIRNLPADQRPQSCLFAKYINPLVNLLSAIVGIVVVVGIILGAIQFASSAGDPQKAANGKNHIRNALLGLLAYLMLYAFLQFIIPGGLLNG